MARRNFAPRSRRKVLAVVLIMFLFALGAVNTRVASTSASWQDTSMARGEFSAADIGPIRNLQCIDSESLLGTGLVQSQVQLTWQPPAGLEDVPLEYTVSWQHSGILGTSGSATTTRLDYTYTAPRLQLLTLNVNFTVTARPIGSTWVGDPSSTSASSVGLLIINVYMDCA